MHGFGELRRGHVVEEDHIHAVEREKVAHLVEPVGLDLHAHAGMLRAETPHIFRELRERGPGGEMVVLHHHHVEKPEAVVRAAAREHGGLFQRAQAGRGLARVEDARAVRLYGIHKFARERGDAAELLDEVQRRALGGEDAADRAGDFDRGVAGLQCVAVPADAPHVEGRIHQCERPHRAIHACEDARFLRKDPRLSAAHGVHEIFARQISAADVLRERERDRVREILNSELPRLRPRLSRCARI